MPELPEVETTLSGIKPHIQGERLDQLLIRERRFRWPIEAGLEKRLQGQKLKTLGRRSKYLLLHFESGTLLLHLGMSGSLRILHQPVRPEKHDHVDFGFANGVLLRFRDPRRFGALVWAGQQWQSHSLIQHLGPEPLSEAFDRAYLFGKSRKRKQAIKQFIMDASTVVGVGNIYANEALYYAGIHPLREAGSLSSKRLAVLVDTIRQVLERAIVAGGTTLKDFESPEGKRGYFVQELAVYGRKGQPCMCCGNLLEEIRLNQRSTVFCGRCQK